VAVVTGFGAYPAASSELVQHVRRYATGRASGIQLARARAKAKRLRSAVERTVPAPAAKQREALTLPAGQSTLDPRGCRGVLRLLGVEGPVAVKYGTLGRKTAGSYRRDGDVHVIWIDHTPSAQEKARTFCHEAAHAAQQEGRATATWTATTRIGPATRTSKATHEE
jgi:hypothetical protein